jgi:hypothetical protein
MRKWMFSFFVAVQLLLMPVLAFGNPNCSTLPWQAQIHNPHCWVPVSGTSPISLPDHWGLFESVGFLALVLIASWVMVRLRILHLNKRA